MIYLGGKVERPRWPYATKLTISLLLLAFFIYLLSRFKEIIPPVIIAIIIAYILNPIVNYLQLRIHLPRSLIILLTYFIVFTIIICIPILVIPIFAGDVSSAQINTQQLLKSLEDALAQQYSVLGITIHPSALLDQVIGTLQGYIQPVIGQTVAIAMSIITSIIWIVFILLVSFYLIKDGTKLDAWVTSHLPSEFLPEYKWIYGEINQIWASFFRGQLLLSTIVAVIFIVVGSILGLPFALAMGILRVSSNSFQVSVMQFGCLSPHY